MRQQNIWRWNNDIKGWKVCSFVSDDWIRKVRAYLNVALYLDNVDSYVDDR